MSLARPFLVALHVGALTFLALGGGACGTSETPASAFDAAPSPTTPSKDGGSPSLFGDAQAKGDGATVGDGGCSPDRIGILRDFKGANEPGGHPDFEYDVIASDPGIVMKDLGPNLKPVYNAPSGQIAGAAKSTHGQTYFDQWYRDTPGVNLTDLYTLPLTLENGKQVFDSTAFFPLDGKGFGDTPGAGHNFHFTFELHTEFEYRGGEVFNFRGDDDVWVFLNKKLAVDLGGIKPAESASVDLDAKASELGIQVGQVYGFDFFFAERHRNASNFRMETTLKFVNCDPILPK